MGAAATTACRMAQAPLAGPSLGVVAAGPGQVEAAAAHATWPASRYVADEYSLLAC